MFHKPIREGAAMAGAVSATDFLAIFEQEWWLNAATRGAIERLETRWDRVLVGSLWYHPVKRGLVKKVELPPFTRFLSPLLTPPPAGPSVSIRNSIRIVEELFAPLEGFDSYHTIIRQPSDLGFPLNINSFQVSSRFAFISEAAVPLAVVEASMHQKTRNLVKSARDDATIEFHRDLDRYQRLHKSRSRRDLAAQAALASIWAEIEKRGAGTLISAVGPRSVDLSTAMLVWDEQRLYFLISAKGASVEADRAFALMFYESIALAKKMTRTFDADGFATAESARSLMKWGLPVSMNLNVHRGSVPYNTLKPFKDRLILPVAGRGVRSLPLPIQGH